MDDKTFKSKYQDIIGLRFFSSEFSKSIPSQDKEKIIDLLTNLKSKKELTKINQITRVLAFYYGVDLFNPEYIKKNPIINEINRIEKGLFTFKILSAVYSKSCEHTYGGFLRELKQGTLQIVNVVVDGKKRTMLCKPGMGDSLPYNDFILKGFNPLLLDPKTLDI
jgi:hypothetical protein